LPEDADPDIGETHKNIANNKRKVSEQENEERKVGIPASQILI